MYFSILWLITFNDLQIKMDGYIQFQIYMDRISGDTLVGFKIPKAEIGIKGNKKIMDCLNLEFLLNFSKPLVIFLLRHLFLIVM